MAGRSSLATGSGTEYQPRGASKPTEIVSLTTLRLGKKTWMMASADTVQSRAKTRAVEITWSGGFVSKPFGLLSLEEQESKLRRSFEHQLSKHVPTLSTGVVGL